jgi:hypothetical protein
MPRKVLVLARGDDLGAWAVAVAIARRQGRDAVTVVRPEQLATGRWVHRVTSDGARTKVSLAGGLDLVDHDIGAVLNRIDGIPPLRFLRSSERDRAYAGAELEALFVSWLHGLDCPVVNPIDAHGPFGRWTRLRWLTLAADLGLPIADRQPAPRPYAVQSPDQDVVVVGQAVFGRLAPRFGGSCTEVARAAGCSLVAFRFSDGDEPRLADADTKPALSGAAIEAAADLLLEEVTRR